jgi:ABC-2 type transport system ATP-binding protein
MSQILVEELSKTYRIAERDPGAMGAIKGLFHRRWRTVEALQAISFAMAEGELVGLIGPNGAATWRGSGWCSASAPSSGGTCR